MFFIIKKALFVMLLLFDFKDCVLLKSQIDSDEPMEIQHATCKIATKDIQATANATISYQLKNVCSTNEIKFLLEKLEQKLLTEIYAIRDALLGSKYENYMQQKSLMKADEKRYKQAEQINSAAVKSSPQFSENATRNISVARDMEAAKYNMTFQNSEFERHFLYYWKIFDIETMLFLPENYIDSSTFSLLGTTLYIRFNYNHLGNKYLALQLKSNSYYVMKHRFVIINQHNEKKDLSSQILGDSVSLYRISYQKIEGNEYTADGSLMIKLIVFL